MGVLLGGICGFWLCSAASDWFLCLLRCSYAFLWRKCLRTAVFEALCGYMVVKSLFGADFVVFEG